MTGNIPVRLRRIEQSMEALQLCQRTCKTCGHPVPSLCGVLMLGPAGVYKVGPPCPDCHDECGGGGLAIDPRTGKPAHEPRLILLGMCFEEWLAIDGDRQYRGAVGLTLDYYLGRNFIDAMQARLQPKPAQEDPGNSDGEVEYFLDWEEANRRHARALGPRKARPL